MELIRIEATNFDWSVADTKDLSTARGGSLAMLHAIQEVDRLFGEAAGPLRAVSLGASLGVFEVTSGVSASTMAQDVRALLATGTANGKTVNDMLKPVLPHLTFTVATATMAAGDLDRPLAELSTRARWEQMQALSFATPETSGLPPCNQDKLRPSTASVMGPNGEPVSASVHERRKYGREQKTAFYRAELQEMADTPGSQVSADDVERLTRSGFAATFADIAEHAVGKAQRLNGKIAVLFADGNGFGALRDAHCRSIDSLRQFDAQLRALQQGFLHQLLARADADGSWRNDHAKGVIRVEVLRWAGDDIMIVVPAWHGWSVLEAFFDYRWSISLNEVKVDLSFKAGLVFCNHKAPIHRITHLAEILADEFARGGEHRVAYEVLESFDHVGLNPSAVRTMRSQPFSLDTLVLNHGQVMTLSNALRTIGGDIPRGQLHDLIRAQRSAIPEEVTKAAARIDRALNDAQRQDLLKLACSLGDCGSHWLHLLELLDYVS